MPMIEHAGNRLIDAVTYASLLGGKIDESYRHVQDSHHFQTPPESTGKVSEFDEHRGEPFDQKKQAQIWYRSTTFDVSASAVDNRRNFGSRIGAAGSQTLAGFSPDSGDRHKGAARDAGASTCSNKGHEVSRFVGRAGQCDVAAQANAAVDFELLGKLTI